jgi:hypothetical protein
MPAEVSVQGERGDPELKQGAQWPRSIDRGAQEHEEGIAEKQIHAELTSANNQ